MSDTTTGPEEKRPRSLGKRLAIGAGVLVLLLTALAMSQYALFQHRAATALKAAVAHLDETDPGWRLHDLEAARPSVPEAENSARVVVAANRLLPRGWPDYKMYRIDGPSLHDPPPQQLDAERLRLLEAYMAAVSAAVIEARRVADMPKGRHRLELAANPNATLLNDYQTVRVVPWLLRYDALLLSHKGRHKEALRSCRAILNVARSISKEPFLITQLVRLAVVIIACGVVEKTLAMGEPPSEELARLQELLQEDEKHSGLLIGLRGDRAICHEIFQGITDGRFRVADFLGDEAESSALALQDRYLPWTVKDLARREHPRMLELMNRAIDIARLPTQEQEAAEKVLEAEIKNTTGSRSLIRSLVPSNFKFAQAARRAVAHRRCLLVLLAVERYRREKGSWPPRLDDLTPRFLSAIPLDPFDGKPLRYQIRPDGVLVYSVGVDGVDNGGNVIPKEGMYKGTDIGHRLWDVAHRRQPAKPEKPK